ncbi:MAG TPA: triose-phosphate isomerase, partial [Bacteroidia bacterium]|nr:triose-phosphate isomerase [Bacteroidia bacterium]
MRRKIIAGNWKMNKTATEASALAQELAVQVRMAPDSRVETIIAPAFPFLLQCARNVNGVPGLHVAAQNCHWENEGAFTGEVSLPMIASTGATHVIVGHSERRTLFGETNAILQAKLSAVLAHGLTPIFCVGETLEERNNHQQAVVIADQMENTVCKLSNKLLERIIIAYEPVWAIGTGLTATPEQAQEMHAVIRNMIANKYGHAAAEQVPILYGGSCNPSNAK